MNGHECDQVPDDPADGDRFTCERCGVSCEFVVLDDGLPGEWVDTTPVGAEAVARAFGVPMDLIDGRPWVARDDELP